jgi:hypothetical protein
MSNKFVQLYCTVYTIKLEFMIPDWSNNKKICIDRDARVRVELARSPTQIAQGSKSQVLGFSDRIFGQFVPENGKIRSIFMKNLAAIFLQDFLPQNRPLKPFLRNAKFLAKFWVN